MAPDLLLQLVQVVVVVGDVRGAGDVLGVLDRIVLEVLHIALDEVHEAEWVRREGDEVALAGVQAAARGVLGSCTVRGALCSG